MLVYPSHWACLAYLNALFVFSLALERSLRDAYRHVNPLINAMFVANRLSPSFAPLIEPKSNLQLW